MLRDSAVARNRWRARSFEGRRFERIAAEAKDVLWLHPERATAVELYIRLMAYRCFLPGLGMDSMRQRIAWWPRPGVETLADGPLFAYLASTARSMAGRG